MEMVTNILQKIIKSSRTTVIRYDVFHSLGSNANTLIGRAAHIAVLDSEIFLEKFLAVCAAKYFRWGMRRAHDGLTHIHSTRKFHLESLLTGNDANRQRVSISSWHLQKKWQQFLCLLFYFRFSLARRRCRQYSPWRNWRKQSPLTAQSMPREKNVLHSRREFEPGWLALVQYTILFKLFHWLIWRLIYQASELEYLYREIALFVFKFYLYDFSSPAVLWYSRFCELYPINNQAKSLF